MRIKTLPDYDAWIANLRDRSAILRITQRLARVELGNMGDQKSVGGGVVELRTHHGPGYRLYLTRRGNDFIILLCGGDKSSQDADIRKAHQLASGV